MPDKRRILIRADSRSLRKIVCCNLQHIQWFTNLETININLLWSVNIIPHTDSISFSFQEIFKLFMSFKRKKKKCKNAKLCSLRLDKGCCGLCAGMFVDKSMPAAVISLIFFRQIGAVTDRRLKFFWKNILTVERGTKVGRGRPPEKQSSLTAVIESILLKNVHIIYFSYFSQIEKARLSLRCDRWSADGGEGVEGGAQCRPRISRCEPAADVSRGCFHDYANSGLNFYFEATVESVFEEQERDWSNNKILKHKINWKERKKKFWI